MRSLPLECGDSSPLLAALRPLKAANGRKAATSRPHSKTVLRTLQVEGPSLFLGGRSDGQDGFEGKIAAVAIFDRGLRSAEIAAHHAAAERTP